MGKSLLKTDHTFIASLNKLYFVTSLSWSIALNKYTLLTLTVIVFVFDLLAFDLSGGRPMGDSIIRYFDKELPDILIHRSFNNSEIDTTEKIITLYNGTQISDIFIYRNSPLFSSDSVGNSNSIYLSGWIMYGYSGGKISSALLKIENNGALKDYEKETYTFTDTSKTIIKSSASSSGNLLELTSKDHFYTISNNKDIFHTNYSYCTNTGWNGKYKEVNYYSSQTGKYDNSVHWSVLSTESDTTWKSVQYSAYLDTSVAIVQQKIGSNNPDTLEKIIKSYDKNGNIKSIDAKLKISSNLIPYSIETFDYFNDSTVYLRSMFDTLTGSYVNSQKEVHEFYNQKPRSIRYYGWDNNTWVLKTEDLFTYSSNSTEISQLKKRLSLGNYKLSQMPGKFIVKCKHFHSNLSGDLYNLSGRKVKSYVSRQVDDGIIFDIKTDNLSKGKYIFVYKNFGSNITIPILIAR